MKMYEHKYARGIITLLFPRYYLEKFYANKRGKKSWNSKKACFTLSFDSDFTEDIEATPSLLDTLSSYPIKTSFACIGKFIEKYPKEHIRIIEEGHEILNHTYTHPDNEKWNPNQKFNELTIEQQKYEIKKCHTVCETVLNYSPVGFRIPHFGRLYTENIYTILKELGYKYSSSTVALKTPDSGLPFMKGDILELPLSPCPKHPFGVFDTWHSLERGGGLHKKEGEFYKLFTELIEIGVKTNSYINVYFDPQDIVKIREFEMMLEHVNARRKDIRVAKYEDVAKYFGISLQSRRGLK